MAVQKNTVTEKIHTALLSLCLTIICFCARTLWEVNATLAKNDEVNSRQDASIANLTIMVAQGQRDNQECSNRITYVEAILPESLRKKAK